MRILSLLSFLLLQFAIAGAQPMAPSCARTHAFNLQSALFMADDSRSDTFDILNYHINLDITDFTTKVISGYTTVTFTPKITSVNYLSLDLLKMQIDSIVLNGSTLTYNYNDTLLIITLPNPFGLTDTLDVDVHYHGVPQIDASGWGGFYYQGGYAYNMGVGFAADPHNYGRVWFPCFDNFVERSTYDFTIRTIQPKRAHCSGYLVSETMIGTDTIERKWRLDQTIPTYLANVAVADFETLYSTHNGIAGPVPIELAAVATDTANVKNSFINLGGAIQTFEMGYGAYSWNKVGFSMVPFSSGAMEHATNITYPRSAANGTLNSETLMAHELAHHWWGNLITCSTAEDMWLNEGWASFSEYLFLEDVYDRKRSLTALKGDLSNMLRYLHHQEGTFLPVSGLPHSLTYSSHVYKKGAQVAHSLRGYLGDSIFFPAITTFLNNNKFTDVSSYDFRDQLSTISGVDLIPFFDNWVFNPGFTNFSIDSISAVPSGQNWNCTVYIKQTVKGAPSAFTEVPLEITFMDSAFNLHIDTLMASGSFSSSTFTLPFKPVYTAPNFNNLLSLATGDDTLWISGTGTHILPNALITIEITSQSDTSFIRAEHHFVSPGGVVPGGIKLSPDRYWKIDGVFQGQTQGKLRIQYDGRTPGNFNGGYLDHNLLGITEDSLILLYRTGPGSPWIEHPGYTLDTQGSLSNKVGLILCDVMLKGEYVLAYGDKKLMQISQERKDEGGFRYYPNPGKGQIHFEFSNPGSRNYSLKIYDLNGRIVLNEEGNGSSHTITIRHLTNGVYTASLELNGVNHTGQLVLAP